MDAEPIDAPPSWIRDGQPVWYASSPHPGHTYAGTVSGEPRRMGSDWVVRLDNMDPSYRDGARNSVPAAACDCLAPRETPDAITHSMDRYDSGERETIPAPEPEQPTLPTSHENLRATLLRIRSLANMRGAPSLALREIKLICEEALK